MISITAASATTSFSVTCSLCYNLSRYHIALPVRDSRLPRPASLCRHGPTDGPLINSTAVLLGLLQGQCQWPLTSGPWSLVSGQWLVNASACTDCGVSVVAEITLLQPQPQAYNSFQLSSRSVTRSLVKLFSRPPENNAKLHSRYPLYNTYLYLYHRSWRKEVCAIILSLVY